MLRLTLSRGFSSSCRHQAKLNVNPDLIKRSIAMHGSEPAVPRQVYERMKRRNSALEAAAYFARLEKTPGSMILTDEYKQLPDDCQFITEHYKELLYYRDKIAKDSYSSMASASELFKRLAEYKPEMGEKRRLFDKFVNDLTTTLRLNGGHLFILDLLIQNQQMFDRFESN